MDRIYIDTCVFNRPFDDQIRYDIRLEAEAKIYIQEKIKDGKLELIWSYILEYENSVNPFLVGKLAIVRWKNIARIHIIENETVLLLAKRIKALGLKSKDALHIACGIYGKADFFITTDKKILKILKDYDEINIINPVDFVMEIEGRNYDY